MAYMVMGSGVGRRASIGMRICVSIVLMSAVGPALYVTGLSYDLPKIISALLVVEVAVALVCFLPRRVGDLSQAGKGARLLFLLWLACSLFGGYRMARLSPYMYDAADKTYAFVPKIRDLPDPELTKPFLDRHCCFTCYAIAAHLATEGVENLYDRERYRDAEIKTEIHETIGEVLTIDTYQYPPPFLILPRLLQAVTSDFFQMRTLWFGMNLVLLAATFLAFVAWLSDWSFRAHWFVWPALLTASTMVGTFVVGNAHLFIILISLLALVAFEKRRHVFGGALLGFAVVSKLFPGLLVLYLVARRRWRAVFWTCGASAIYVMATFVLFGAKPFTAFAKFQAPRLQSGEAFSFAFERLRPTINNSSVLGIVYKLARLDLYSMESAGGIAKIVTWAFSVFLVVVAVWVGLRQGRGSPRGGLGRETSSSEMARMWSARVWIALLVLAQLRSPFLPWGYGNVAVIWLVVMMLPLPGSHYLPALLVVPLWALFTPAVPLFFGPLTEIFDLVYTLVAAVLVVGLCLMAVVRYSRAPRSSFLADQVSADVEPVLP